MKFSKYALSYLSISGAMASAQELKVKARDVKYQGGVFAQAGVIDEIREFRETAGKVGSLLSKLSEMKERIQVLMRMQAEDDFVESIVSRVESLILLLYDLSTRERLADMIVPVAMFLKTWIPNQSLFLKIHDMMVTILTKDSDDKDVKLEGQAGWFESNWSTLTEGPFGKRIGGLISLLIMSGMLPKDCQSVIGKEFYGAFHVHAIKRDHPSILHHIFSTIDWMIDSVIPAVRKDDWSLLMHDQDFCDMDERFRNCLEMVHLNVTGGMDSAMRKFGVKNEAAIIVYLTEVTHEHSVIHKTTKDKKLAAEMHSRIIRLNKLSNDVQAGWRAAGLRVKPYGIFVCGPSGIGKSIIMNLACHVVCKHNDLPEGEEYWCTINGNDKYQSEYRSQHICVIFDDVGNTKPERADGNPLFILIQFINTMHCCALSPEAEKKGKNDIRAKVVGVTSNTDHLHSAFFSVNPASIMRRFEVVIKPHLKPDCANAEGTLDNRFKKDIYPDAWDFSVYRVKIVRNTMDEMADNYVFVPYGQRMNIIELMEFLAADSKRHLDDQDMIVSNSKHLHKRPHCSEHPLFTHPCVKCRCEGKQCFNADGKPVDENDVPLEAEDDVINVMADYLDAEAEKRLKEMEERELLAKKTREYHQEMMEDNDRLECQAGPFWNPKKEVDPSPYLQCDPEGKDGITRLLLESEEKEEESYLSRINRLVMQGCNSCAPLVRKAKEIEVDTWIKVLGAFAAMGLAGMAMSQFSRPIQGQGAILSKIQAAGQNPQTFVEKDNKYQKVYTQHSPAPRASVSSKIDDLERAIDNNLYAVVYQEINEETYEPIGKRFWCNAFPVEGIVWATTAHQFQRGKTYLASFQRHPGTGVKKFDVMLNEANLRWADDADIVFMEIPDGGSVKPFSKFMVDDLSNFTVEKGAPIFIYHLHKEYAFGEKEHRNPSDMKETSKIEEIKRESMSFQGVPVGDYDLMSFKAPNHAGKCGSMIFLAGRNPILIGMHVAGQGDRSAAALLDRTMIPTFEGVQVASEEDLPEVLYGRSLEVGPQVHPWSPVHYIDDPDANIKVYGQHNFPLSRFKSDIVESPMLPALKEKLGFEPTHTAPPKKGAIPSRRRHLLNVSKKLPPPNPKYVKMAIADFKMKLSEVVFNEKFMQFVHPIPLEVALSGEPGVKGFDPINPKTSMGFWLNSPKWKFFAKNKLEDIVGLDTVKFVTQEVIDGKTVYKYTIEFDKEKFDVEAELEEVLEKFADGRRANLIFRLNLKDEPVTWKKAEDNKIRAFAGAPVTMVILCRMLTLPLINMMSHFPGVFESAVGIDATGKDWEWLYKYMSQFGFDRCGDGDFEKFDTWLRANFTKGSFDIIRTMLEKAGLMRR